MAISNFSGRHLQVGRPVDILVVDDDLTTRKMLRFVLEQQAGHSVTEADDAPQAQSALARQSFDLALDRKSVV